MSESNETSPRAWAKPRCDRHDAKSMVKAKIIEPVGELITGVEFWLCAAEGCGRLWDEEGNLAAREASQ